MFEIVDYIFVEGRVRTLGIKAETIAHLGTFMVRVVTDPQGSKVT